MIYKKFIGTGVALVTPFNEDLSVDFDSLEKIVEYNISNGIDYLVVNGTTGESVTVSHEERKEIVKKIVRVNNNRVPLVLGMGGNNTSLIVNKINSFDLNDFSAILSVSPYYNKPTQEGLYQHYKFIVNNTSIPIILYNVPGRTSKNMSADTTIRLASDFDSIIGIKEASGNLDQYLYLIKNKPDDFLIISGDDDLALSSVLAGGHGVISVLGQAIPNYFSKMINLGLNGNSTDSKKINNSLKKVTKLIFKENNPAGIKYILSQMNLCDNFVRLPLVSVTSDLSIELNLELHNLKKIM